MRPVVVAIAVSLGALVLVGCGSGRRSVTARYDYIWQAASRISAGCAHHDAPGSDRDGFLWLRGGSRPLVYYRETSLRIPEVVSSLGDHFSLWGEFWPCRTPVAVYLRPPSPDAVLARLASASSQRKTIVVGRFRLAEGMDRNATAGSGNAIVAANGRIVFFSGQTIRYAGGRELTGRGIPHGWSIDSLSVSPRNPSVFLANADSTSHVAGGCRAQAEPGGLFLVTPGGSTELERYDQCQGGDSAGWSPDGRHMLLIPGGGGRVDLADGLGRHRHPLLRATCGIAWSPDGREIAYGPTCKDVRVLDLATGVSHLVGKGRLEGWSPDGTEIALLRGPKQWYGTHPPRGAIVAVPAAGGPGRLLMKTLP